MRNQIRIPTLLGLGILLTGLTIGVLLVVQQQTLTTKASGANTPQNISIANIESTAATITWQTDSPVTGFVQAGPQPALGLTFKDDRDQQDLDLRQIHFVTLRNLSPNTSYYFKIVSGGVSFPEKDPLTLTTSPELPSQPMSPVIGSILDVTGHPVNEALIILDIDGAQKLATYTKTASSFIIPLATLKTNDLNTPFTITEKTPQNASLTISIPGQTTTVRLTLPTQTTTLPTITIGKNLDLTRSILSTTSAANSAASNSAQPGTNIYDLNKDGSINSADRAIIQSNIGKTKFDPQADLNHDKVVNQKDLDLFTVELQKNSQQ